MPSTFIMPDDSAFAMNVDYLTIRWEGQVDAASLLIQAKI